MRCGRNRWRTTSGTGGSRGSSAGGIPTCRAHRRSRREVYLPGNREPRKKNPGGGVPPGMDGCVAGRPTPRPNVRCRLPAFLPVAREPDPRGDFLVPAGDPYPAAPGVSVVLVLPVAGIPLHLPVAGDPLPHI